MGRKLTTEHLPPGATAFSFKGELYVPTGDGSVTNIDGIPVELPDDFPSDEELAANLKRTARSQPTTVAPAGTSGSGKAQAASGDGAEDYESMTKDDLAQLASDRGVEVKRAGGEDGDPLKGDYVKALKKHAKASK